MATLTLRVSDKIFDRVLWLLGQFKPGELEVLATGHLSEGDKSYVETELIRLETGESKKFSFEEVDKLFETTIAQYEN